MNQNEDNEWYLMIVGLFVKFRCDTAEGPETFRFRGPISFSCQAQDPSR